MPKAKRLQGKKFCPITEERARDWYIKGYIKTTAYLLIIKEILVVPNASLTIRSVEEFCREWHISRSTFYHAISLLKAHEDGDWISLGGLVFSTRDVVTNAYHGLSNSLDSQSNELDSQSNELDSQSNELDSQSNELDSQSNELDTRGLHPLSDNDPSPLQTMEDLEDLENSLSDRCAGRENAAEQNSAGEREDFSTKKDEEFFISYKNADKDLGSESEASEIKKASLANQPRSKNTQPRSSSKGKGFGARPSTNESKSSTIKQLGRKFGLLNTMCGLVESDLEPDRYEECLRYLRQHINSLPKTPSNPDAYVVSKLESLIVQFEYESSNKELMAEEKKKAVKANKEIQEQQRQRFEAAYKEHLEKNDLEHSLLNKQKFSLKYNQGQKNDQ